jgi:hypothetical protein
MGEWVQNVQEFNLSRRLRLWLSFCTPMRYLSKHRNKKRKIFKTNIGANGFVFRV